MQRSPMLITKPELHNALEAQLFAAMFRGESKKIHPAVCLRDMAIVISWETVARESAPEYVRLGLPEYGKLVVKVTDRQSEDVNALWDMLQRISDGFPTSTFMLSLTEDVADPKTFVFCLALDTIDEEVINDSVSLFHIQLDVLSGGMASPCLKLDDGSDDPRMNGGYINW